MACHQEREASPLHGPGTYLLVMEMVRDTEIRVGALGQIAFRAGHYLYVGSALGGLAGRLRRHLRSQKRLHWHIDYFLQHARICQVWWHPGDERLECLWARECAALSGAHAVDARLGASDCSCRTHLLHLTQRPMLPEIAPRLSHARPLGWATPASVLPGCKGLAIQAET